jgi:hypothetical protein
MEKLKVYECQCCNFVTPLKANYNRHINTEVHKLKEKIKELEDEIQKLKDELSKSSNVKKRTYDIQPIELVEEVITSSNTNSNYNENKIISTNTIIKKVEQRKRKNIIKPVMLDEQEKIPEVIIVEKPPEDIFMDKFYKIFNNPTFNKCIKMHKITDEYEEDEKVIILKTMESAYYLDSDLYKKILLPLLEGMNYNDPEIIKCVNYKDKKFIVNGETYDKMKIKALIEKMINGISTLLSKAFTNSIKVDHSNFGKYYGLNLNDFNSSIGNKHEIINCIFLDDERKEKVVKHLSVDISKKFSKNADDIDSDDEKKKKPKETKLKPEYNEHEDGDY